jgi:hypothetical protein
MTPFNANEAKMMQDIATLKSEVGSLQRWQIEVDRHDDAQDKALYKVESDVRDLYGKFQAIVDGHKDTMRLLKTILAVAVPATLDATGWNFWKKFGPLLQPYMTEDFFWLVLSSLMLLSIGYAIYVLLFHKKGKEEKK